MSVLVTGLMFLNQLPSIVMFGMNEFYVSASGAIQGHYGPIVFLDSDCLPKYKEWIFYFLILVL